MRPELEKIIDANYDRLSRQLDSDSGLLNRLLEREVITSDHMADIKAERTPRRRNEVLLDILKRRDDKYFEIFKAEVSVLQKQLASECLCLTDEALTTAVKETVK